MIKEIKTAKLEGLAVLMPDDAHTFEIQVNNVEGGNHIGMLLGKPDYDYVYSPNLPEGKYEILGKATELTEEQCAEIMPLIDEEEPQYGYELFMTEEEFNRTDRVEACDSAKDSFNSYMYFIECYCVNPYGKEPKDISDLGAFTQMIRQKWVKWKEAQANTGTWVILKKL